jgi:hypothetical protein
MIVGSFVEMMKAIGQQNGSLKGLLGNKTANQEICTGQEYPFDTKANKFIFRN